MRSESGYSRLRDASTSGRAGSSDCARVPGADGDHRRGAVPEQAGGHEVGDRRVVTLEGQRAQLDRHQHRDPVRPSAQQVVEPGHARRSRHAPQADEGQPHRVGPQPDLRRDAGLQRGHGEPGHRAGHDVVDVGRGEADVLERVDHRTGPQLHAGPDEGVVGPAEVAGPGVLVQRQHGVPGLDAHVAMEPFHDRAVDAAAQRGGEGRGDLLLTVSVPGQGAADAEDAHGHAGSGGRLVGWSAGRRVGGEGRGGEGRGGEAEATCRAGPGPARVSTSRRRGTVAGRPARRAGGAISPPPRAARRRPGRWPSRPGRAHGRGRPA